MIRHGILRIVNGESRLDDGTLLARCSDPSPLLAATAFMQSHGCEDGDLVVVTGTDGTIGSVAVFCIDDAKPVGSSVPNLLTVIPKGLADEAATDKIRKAGLLQKASKPGKKRKTQKKKAGKR